MVAVKAADIEARLRRPDPSSPVILLYGPDAGLVGERAKLLAETTVQDPADPFQLVKLAGDDVASDPERLLDEANTIGLFGGRRAIWVKPSSRSIASAVAPLLATPPINTIVIIEAGDLRRTAPLVSMCEKSPAALAICCYGDETRTLASLVDDTLKAAGLRIDRDAREILLSLVGADRLATRNELAKLALYMHGHASVTAEDVEAVVGDVSTLTFDAALDAAFSGDLDGLDRALARLRAEGLDFGVLIGMAVRHALMLARARLEIETGVGVAAQLDRMHGLNFRRKETVARQLRVWTSARLLRAAAACGEAVATARRQSGLSHAVAQRTLLDIARSARRR